MDDLETQKYKNYENPYTYTTCMNPHISTQIGTEDHMKVENPDRSTFTSVLKYIEVKKL